MDNATVSSLYCIALYDNYIALNDKVQKWRNFSKVLKKTKSPPPPPKIFPVLIKFDKAHIVIPPAIQREEGI
jgi:hypothetical protein